MSSRTHFAVFALLTAAIPLSGFQGGCGQREPIDINTPSPSPTPSPTACTDKDEAQCSADASCTAVYVDSGDCVCPACAPDTTCPPCQCAPTTRTFVGCQDRDPCEGLDPVACEANPACDYLYAASDAAFRPCEPGVGDGCGAPPPAGACVPHQECPAVCDIACEFGNVVDPNGCPLCACNPPPDRCSGLDEVQCTQTPGCSPIYGGSGGGCACPLCAPGAECPPCECAEDRIAPSEYQGCVETDPCAGLPEAQCSSTPGCEPIYSGGPRKAEPDSGSGSGSDEAAPPAPDGYAGCVSVPVTGPCERLDERQCSVTPGCYAVYESSGCTAPAPPCDSNDPGCRGGTGGEVCVPETRFAGCFPAVPPPTNCTSNADCRAGEVCEFPMSGGGSGAACPESDCNRPEPLGQCVPAHAPCDDGQPAVCAMPPPVCRGGLIPAAQNGCYVCVDPTSCQPPAAELCSSDADCANGYCDVSGSGEAPDPDPGTRPVPVYRGVCVYPSCDDGSVPTCLAQKPICEPGEVAAVVNGCFSCVDARTCR